MVDERCGVGHVLECARVGVLDTIPLGVGRLALIGIFGDMGIGLRMTEPCESRLRLLCCRLIAELLEPMARQYPGDRK